MRIDFRVVLILVVALFLFGNPLVAMLGSFSMPKNPPKIETPGVIGIPRNFENPTLLADYSFNSSMVPTQGGLVYYIVVGENNQSRTIYINYISSSGESNIGTRRWEQLQKCIAWDLSYDWTVSNIGSVPYMVRLQDSKDIAIKNVFIMQDYNEFIHTKQVNC